jgi:guanosine-diphosphatase
LDVLFDQAERVVPRALWGCTPVVVKATAGLRLIGEERSRLILEAVEGRLRERYSFWVPEGGEGVAVMEGRDEGVYAWLTANYLLGTLKGGETYAVLDLGGASTQIVFEPTFGADAGGGEVLLDGEHKYDLRFSGQTYVLYQHSYLGYGLMRARGSVHRLVEFMASLRPGAGAGDVVWNPCLAKGTQRVVQISDDGRNERNVTMSGGDIGSFEACNRIIELVLAKDASVPLLSSFFIFIF